MVYTGYPGYTIVGVVSPIGRTVSRARQFACVVLPNSHTAFPAGAGDCYIIWRISVGIIRAMVAGMVNALILLAVSTVTALGVLGCAVYVDSLIRGARR